MNPPKSLQDIIYSVLGNHKALDGSTLISDLEFDSISTLDLFNQIDQLFFATGPHICPGMSIGNHLWEKTSEAFLKINKKIKVIKIIRRETDNVFNTYESIKIDVLN